MHIGMQGLALSLINVCKYLQASFVFFCATSIVEINFVNTDFILSVTYSSYCIVFIRNVEKKAYKIHFWIWHKR